ncbi:hotdog family protein [Aeromonas bivalvium]|uniref:ApeP family dehydratase n=2 Tax=Aeromonas bivalvium TaxID=440079 RepID=UPI000DD042E3|nr:hotdog family protein [Aeromonas bivalvium]
MNEIAIDALLPHQAPMLLLDRLLDYQGSRVCCETRVGERHALLLDADGALPGWVGIELMAQTIAAWAGMRGRERGEPVRIGMLLGSRQYRSRVAAFAPGDCLTIEAECLLEDGAMASFECRILREGQPCAEARLSTYLPAEGELAQLLAPSSPSSP